MVGSCSRVKRVRWRASSGLELGISVSVFTVPGSGVPERLYRFDVDQQVKGDIAELRRWCDAARPHAPADDAAPSVAG